MGTVANLVVRVSANVSDFDKQIKSLEKSMGTTGSRLQSTGAKLTAGLTLPIVALGGASIKAAMDFEDAFSGVAKTVDGVANSKGKLTTFGKELSQGFRDLAKTIPVTVNELAKIGEVAGAMGIPAGKILNFTEVMAKLGATTDLTSDQAAASIGKIQNVYQAAGINTDRFASSLVALGNAGASTESQIMAFAERMGGAAVQAGVAQSEMLGWANAMASVGIQAELGSTAWNKTISSIGMAVDMGGEKLNNFAAVAGMTSQAFSTLFKADASEAMNRVVEGFQRVQTSGGNVTKTMVDLGMKSSGVQMTFKNLASSGDMVRKSLDLGKKAWQDNIAMEEEFTKKSATTISQLKVLYNRVYDLGISLGEQLIPAFMRLWPAIENVLGVMVKAVQLFSALPPSIQTGVIAVVALVAALGPLVYAVGTVMTAGSGLLTMYRMLVPAQAAVGTTAAVARTGLLGFASAGMALSAAPIVAAVAAIGAAFVLLVPRIQAAIDKIGAWNTAKGIAGGLMSNGFGGPGMFLAGFGGDTAAPTRKDINLPYEGPMDPVEAAGIPGVSGLPGMTTSGG
jgi:TP901 family phage tail tape measure protein